MSLSGTPPAARPGSSPSPTSPEMRAMTPARSSISMHRPPFVHASSSYSSLSRPSPGPTDLQPCPYSFLPHTKTTLHVQAPSSPVGANDYTYPSEKDHAHPLPTITLSRPSFDSPGTERDTSYFLYSARRSPHPSTVEVWTSRLFSARRALSARLASSPCHKERGLARWLFLGWCGTTVLFLLATAFWRSQLFASLDLLSVQLASSGYQGQAIFASLILLTTIPPLPLYSTLVVVSGYTFGCLPGFGISYAASLVGAVLVFSLSRHCFRNTIERSLASSPTATTLLQLLHDRPSLLLMVRVAPYPYNLLNVLLASSPIGLGTYTACTAMSLCKLILHTWIGAGLKDLSGAFGHGQLHGHDRAPELGTGGWVEDPEDANGAWDSPPHHRHRPLDPYDWLHPSPEDVKFYSTVAGIALCIGLFVYITRLTKKALEAARQEQAQHGAIALEDSCRETV